MNQLIKIAPLMLLISGCVVGPDWQTPETALPAQFVGQQNASLHEVSEREWWREMNDPQLTALIERGLLQSLDLGAALEQVYQADAALRATGVNSALDGSLAADHTYTKTEGQSGGWATNGSLSAGLVLDFFGGVRREREAAVANLMASEANVEVERLAWLAELVSNYTNARYYQQAMRLTESTIDTRQETLDITEQEYNAGSSTSYNVAIVQAALQSSQAELPAYQALYEASVFAIATLINEPAGPLLAQLDGTQSALQLPTTIDGGLPADLLRNRPDLRYYQSVLHQQMAGVGVSEAALYPSFSLDGVVSVTDSVTAWSFGPSLTLGLFNQGALRAQRDQQMSVARQAEITWRSAVYAAVEDVQTTQSALLQYRKQSALLDQAAASYDKALQLGRTNFRAGAMTLLDLLDTDRSSASAQISAASAHNNALQSWASLQIALGAGAAYMPAIEADLSAAEPDSLK